ncbi:hypothetical protein D3C86_1192770 [compost metagenome]
MHLKAVAFCGRLAVIGNGHGQEMILDIGLFQTGCGTQEGAGLELVGGAKPAF